MSSHSQQSKLYKKGFIDFKMCSGDSPRIGHISKEDEKPKEENNNDIDGLSSELQMGCIVDAVKRPSNICVESCVYNEDDEAEPKYCLYFTKGTGNETGTEEAVNDDDDDVAYSDDDFEEDFEDNMDNVKCEPIPSEADESPDHPQSSIKLSKSNSFMSSKGRAHGSVSGKSATSSKYGPLSVPRTQRVNMSFSNDRLREIERHNHILLNKILYARNVSKSSIPAPAQPAPPRRPPAAMQRNKLQRQIDHDNMSRQRGEEEVRHKSYAECTQLARMLYKHTILNKILYARNVSKSSIPPYGQIDHDNMILLRKIQRAKSSSCSRR